jgi:radical SAM superfamily enzyme YgiQ (UPF0313 family)
MKNVGVNLVALNPGRYSLALGYLEANLKQAKQLAGQIDVHSIVVNLDDARVCGFDFTAFLHRITRNRPRILAFSVFLWNDHIVREAARLVARLFPEITIVLGGPQFGHYCSVWDGYPETAIIVIGEGESPLTEIVECVLQDEPFDRVEGIAFKQDGAWRISDGRAPQDLAQIASPILEGTLTYPDGDWLPSYSISRGCQYRCSYCRWGDGLGIRFFPMDRVEQELEILSRAPFERVWFTDCLFGADEERYVWLLQKLARWPGSPAFGFETRAELLTPRLIAAFSRVKLDFLAIGIQTLDPKVLANIDRRHNEQRVFDAIDRLLPAIRQKSRIHLDVILGLPGDSVEGVKRTIDTLHARYPEASFFAELLKVLPGTELWETATTHGWVRHGSTQLYDLVQTDSFTLGEVMELKMLGLGLGLLQHPRVRPHARRVSDGVAYSDLALAAGAYLSERGLGAQHEFEGRDWLSTRVAKRTRRMLREIAAVARGELRRKTSTAEPVEELIP